MAKATDKYSTKKTRSSPRGDMRPSSKDNAQRRKISHEQVKDINSGKKVRPKTYFGKSGQRLSSEYRTGSKRNP